MFHFLKMKLLDLFSKDNCYNCDCGDGCDSQDGGGCDCVSCDNCDCDNAND